MLFGVLSVWDIVTFALFAYVFIMGLVQMISGKAFGYNAQHYTPESLKKFARPSGGVMMFIAVAATIMVCGHFNFLSKTIEYIGLGGIIVGIVIYIILTKNILVKTAAR